MTIQLRSLKLIHMSLRSLVSFLSVVEMPLLEKFDVIEIYDDTLHYLLDFQHCIQSKRNFPRLHLSSIRFLFRFPGQLEIDWKKY